MSRSPNSLSGYPGWAPRKKRVIAASGATGARKTNLLIMGHSQSRNRVEKPSEDERQTRVIPDGLLEARDERAERPVSDQEGILDEEQIAWWRWQRFEFANGNCIGRRKLAGTRRRKGRCGRIEISSEVGGNEHDAVEAAAVPFAVMLGFTTRGGVARFVARRLLGRSRGFVMSRRRPGASGRAQCGADTRLENQRGHDRRHEIQTRSHSPVLRSDTPPREIRPNGSNT